MCILPPFYIKIYPFFDLDIFLTLEAGIYLVKLEFSFATQHIYTLIILILYIILYYIIMLDKFSIVDGNIF